MSRRLLLPPIPCLLSLLLGSPLPAQSVWTKVPAFPKACYAGEDAGDVEKALTELETLLNNQKQVNRGLQEQVMNADPATLQQRLMAAVQRNPARAQEIIQATQAFAPGTAQNAAVMAGEAEDREFKDRKAKLIADYRAEWNAALGSIYRRAAGLDGDTRGGGSTAAERAAAWAEYNRKYETEVCPKWFAKQVPDLLASYRAFLVEQRISKRAETEAVHLPTFEMLGVSTKAFRPVAEMEAVVDYLRFATELFGMRERTPGPPPPP
jgi:hypothetical protein